VIERSLFYFGTKIEVLLGDRVEVRGGWFRKTRRGVVCYMPGESVPHPEMEYDGMTHWAIQLEDGTVCSWLFVPDQLQP